MKALLNKIWHMSPAQYYVIIRYSIPDAVRMFISLKLHQLGLSRYPEAIAVSLNQNPLDMAEVKLGSVVRFPSGEFYKVVEHEPGIHIRFTHMDDLNKGVSNA